MFRKYLRFNTILLLTLCLFVTNVFASENYIFHFENVQERGIQIRNNPFTYSYEYDELTLTTNEHFTQSEAQNRDKWIDVIAIGLMLNKYTLPIGAAISIYNALDGSHKQAGTLKIWTGEKRQIATSVITGKSHVANRWLEYKIMYIGDDGSVLVNRNGSVHID